MPGSISEKCPITVFVEHEHSEYPSPWVDSKESPLENRIREIAIGLIVIGEMYYRANELHRYQWRVRQKATAEEAIRKRNEEALRVARTAELREQKRREDWLFEQLAVLAWHVGALNGQREVQGLVQERLASESLATMAKRVRIAFALDCCDREAMSWIATTRGIDAQMVQDMMAKRLNQGAAL